MLMNSFFQKDLHGNRISRGDGRVFGVTGVWKNWGDPSTSVWERTFPVIITVAANELLR